MYSKGKKTKKSKVLVNRGSVLSAMGGAMIDTKIVELYTTQKRDLIPISPSDPHKQKRPLHKDWINRKYGIDEIESYRGKGLNLGWRLGHDDLVIDVDQKNNGLESLDEFLELFELSLDDLILYYPVILTGGKGLHVYTKVPTDLRIKEVFEEYPGIEFKRHKRQVIIPGSIHPSKRVYQFEDFSPYEDPARPLIEPILNWLKEHSVYKAPTGSKPEITPEQLTALLDVLPVEDFADNNSWFQTLAAAHSATRGHGKEEFLEWSLADPVYADHERIISSRWDSLRENKDNTIGINTLYSLVNKYDPKALVEINHKQIKEDFESFPIPETKTKKPSVESLCENLSISSTLGQVEDILKRIVNESPLKQSAILALLKKQTKHSLPALKTTLKELKRNSQTNLDDLVQSIASFILQKRYKNTELINPSDQRFWEYRETNWECLPDNMIKKIIHDDCNEYRQQNPTIEFSVSQLIHPIEIILKARTATEYDIFRIETGPPSVINTQNYELWIDPLTGACTPKSHKAKSYLTSCLDVDYNRKAKCPLFEQTLEEIFEEEHNPKEAIRHVLEIMAYAIQPNKNIATWVLFYGLGSNGKTVLLNVWSALLKNAALEQSIKELGSDYAHSFADLPGKLLVIDEDVQAGTLLPDSVLKKISENKTLTANPKYFPRFKFKSTALICLASNHLPQTRDLSDGLKRRAMIIPFRRQFSPQEMDLQRAEKIIADELPGVLNLLLKALKRLRKRKGFEVPSSCQSAKRNWIEESNPINAFVSENFIQLREERVLLLQVWGIYGIWKNDTGLKMPLSRIGLKKALKQMGYTVRKSTGNQIYVYGLKPRKQKSENIS